VRQALLDAVRTHGGSLLPLSQVPDQLATALRQVRLSMNLLIAVAGLVAVLGMVNAVLSSVAERRREIGLLRAVGATRRQVARLIVAEMALLGGAAALLGTALGWGITFLFLAVGRAALGLPGEGLASLTAWLPLVAASLGGLVLWPLLAMLGGLGPALHAAHQPILPSLPRFT
jgi:putative ABC transport system permease protein